MARVPRTLRDQLLDLGVEVVRVKCPGCGRLVADDELVDCAGVPEVVRGPSRFACDGCTSTWLREGRITRQAFIEAVRRDDG